MKTSPTTRREAFTTAGLAILSASLAPSTLDKDLRVIPQILIAATRTASGLAVFEVGGGDYQFQSDFPAKSPTIPNQPTP